VGRRDTWDSWLPVEHRRHNGARLGSTRLVTAASLPELPSGPIDGFVTYRRLILERSQVFCDLAGT